MERNLEFFWGPRYDIHALLLMSKVPGLRPGEKGNTEEFMRNTFFFEKQIQFFIFLIFLINCKCLNFPDFPNFFFSSIFYASLALSPVWSQLYRDQFKQSFVFFLTIFGWNTIYSRPTLISNTEEKSGDKELHLWSIYI